MGQPGCISRYRIFVLSPSLLADLVLLVHLGFVLFVLLGGLFVLWKRWVMWVHLPAAAWGIYIEVANRVCPLTPLEQRLREAAGERGYSGGFVEHYVTGTLYPGGLERWHQLVIAALVLIVNVAIYRRVFRRVAG